MKKLPAIPAYLALAIVMATACESSNDWPPHQDELSLLFDRQKDTFIVIEKEMIADGIKRMGPAIYAESDRSPVVATIPSLQMDKYVALFERTAVYLDVTRQAESTSFELLLQNVGPRLYLSRFIHTPAGNELPVCSAEMQRAPCGTCSIRLERDWLLQYSWFPADPEVEAREC